jgi:hypothetical protein
VADILPRLSGCAERRALVFSNGHLAGIITPSDITRMIDRLCPGQPVVMAGQCCTDRKKAIQGDVMPDSKRQILYAAAYENVTAALAALDAIEQLHKDEMIGSYDAAVIDKENGKPHIVKRMDRPRVRVIPEAFGSGALPRKELHEAAEQLTASEAGLIVVGEPTIEQALDKAIAGAADVVKRFVDATTDEVASELREALKS